MDLGDAPPRDLYVSWRDFAFSSGSAAPVAPLGHLAHIITRGARVVDARRVTSRGSKRSEPLQVVARSTATEVPALTAPGGAAAETTTERAVYSIGGAAGVLGALLSTGEPDAGTRKEGGSAESTTSTTGGIRRQQRCARLYWRRQQKCIEERRQKRHSQRLCSSARDSLASWTRTIARRSSSFH